MTPPTQGDLNPESFMKMRIKNLLLLRALIADLALIPAGRVAAQTLTTLHRFTGGGGKGVPKMPNGKPRMTLPGLKAPLIRRTLLPGLLFGVCCFCTIAGGQTSSIIVHCLNPEGKEIDSISGVGQTAAAIYDGDTLIGYGAYNEATYNQPITLTTGAHAIKVIFNGIVLTQDISLVSGQQRVLTFVFTRTTWDIANFLNSKGSFSVSNPAWDLPSFTDDNYFPAVPLMPNDVPLPRMEQYVTAQNLRCYFTGQPDEDAIIVATQTMEVNAGGATADGSISLSGGCADPSDWTTDAWLLNDDEGNGVFEPLWQDIVPSLRSTDFDEWFVQFSPVAQAIPENRARFFLASDGFWTGGYQGAVSVENNSTYSLQQIPAGSDVWQGICISDYSGYCGNYTFICSWGTRAEVWGCGIPPGAKEGSFHYDGVRIVSVPYDVLGTAVGSDEGVPILGVVNSSCVGQVVSGALVQIGNVVTTSDSGGSYSISGIPPGTYSATVTAINYVTLTNTVTIPPSSVYTNDFTLYSSPSLVPLRVSFPLANVSASDSIDAPIVPTNDPTLLSAAAPLGMGVVADEVTPVLLQFTGAATNYTVEITDDADSDNGTLAGQLSVLQGGQWNSTTNLTSSSFAGGCTAYMYLGGLTWTNFSGTPANGVTVTLNVHAADDSSVAASTNLLVRPPPIALVHGIAEDNTTWGPDFLSTLASNCPPDFIIPVQYGVGQSGQNPQWPNAYGPFDALSVMLDDSLQQQFEAPLRAQWAFTRYDVVGHSQGGVLLRMLCQTDRTLTFAPFSAGNGPVVSVNNFYRGRFRRVVTIGSPQNGSLVSWYIINMQTTIDWSPIVNWAWFSILSIWNQPKFDPFGAQICEINNPLWPVDSRIKFNCVRTTIAGGAPPNSNFFQNPLMYQILGLWFPSGSAGKSRGQVLLPNGSDGVVDYSSEIGGSNSFSTTITDNDIAHADIPLLFGVPPGQSQTTSAEVAGMVGSLLNGPTNNFGAFQIPTLLTPADLQAYRALLPSTIIVNNLIQFLPQPLIVTTNVNLTLQIPTNLANAGPISWSVQVFGTNGISTNGVSLQVNTNDSTQATVSISNVAQASVVLYATYVDTNGDLVFAAPFVVASDPVGAPLSGIQLNPSSATMSPGDTLTTSIWGDYTNGIQSLLFISAGQANYVSSNPNVAGVDSDGTITMNSFGTATIAASYNGFTSQTVITSLTPSVDNFSGTRLTNGIFQLSFFGTVGTTNIVEASTNLINWVPIATLHNTNGFLQFLDVSATNFPARFYRIEIANIGSTSILPFVWISSQSLLSNGAFQLTLTGTAGVTNIIQTSTNLNTWAPLATLLNTNGVIYFLDQSATNAGQNFYRVMIPQ
jgi:pimeloyl-ACP methyl ester carboxylesterase